MSADLFAEFSTPTQEQQPSGNKNAGPAATFSFFDDFPGTAPTPAPVTQPQQPQQTFSFGNLGDKRPANEENDDDWGDFEGSYSTAPAPPASAKQDPFAFVTPQQPSQPTWNSRPVEQDPFAFSTGPSSQSMWDTPAAEDAYRFSSFEPSQPAHTSWQKAPVVKAKKSMDSRVLFDAEEEADDDDADDDDADDDDDFGDFEGPESSSTSAAPANSGVADLLGDMSISQQQASPKTGRKGGPSRKGPKSPATKKHQSGGFGSVSQTKQISPMVTKEEDPWDTFDDWEASIPTKVSTKAPTMPKESRAVASRRSVQTPPVLSPTFDDPQPGESPPTNVPPPGVLLTLFPSFFADAQSKLFKPMAAQALPMRNKLLVEPATIAYLQGYLMLASVAARIIAGRKFRWKRDKHLSQGMRIGPASSRATSGMKLTGIDKSENMKEEREVADVVRTWKDQIGRLRHVVSAANQIRAGTLGVIPELQETMPVRTLKQVEGGVPAPQPCMLCGLKRDERVGTAEHDVEDSFGEWWVDQVNMHRGCRNFWQEHQDRLRQR